MLFNLKKFFGAMLMPLPLLMLLMGLALLLLWFTRWQKSGKTIFTLSWLFYCFSACSRWPTGCCGRSKPNTRLIAATIRSVTSWCWAGAIPTIPIGRPARICSATACRA